MNKDTVASVVREITGRGSVALMSDDCVSDEAFPFVAVHATPDQRAFTAKEGQIVDLGVSLDTRRRLVSLLTGFKVV